MTEFTGCKCNMFVCSFSGFNVLSTTQGHFRTNHTFEIILCQFETQRQVFKSPRLAHSVLGRPQSTANKTRSKQSTINRSQYLHFTIYNRQKFVQTISPHIFDGYETIYQITGIILSDPLLWYTISQDLLTIVKRRKLQWYGHASRSTGLVKTILQGTWKGEEDKARQRKRWEDNTREWTGLEFAKFQKAVEKNKEKWRKKNWLWNHLWCPNDPRV